jgi:hypothetical protein
MEPVNNKLFLISGSPRSGTTWLAEILGTSPGVNYIKGEPFNPGVSKALFGIHWDDWYPDLSSAQRQLLNIQLPNAFNLKWSFKLLTHRLSWAFKYGNSKDVFRTFKYLLLAQNKKPSLVKDPMALFTLEKLQDVFQPKTIIIVRQPAAFVYSMKRLNWGFSFKVLDNKSEQVKKISSQYQDEIDELNNIHYQEKILERSTIFWCIVYEYLHQLLQKYPEWILVRHEDLSINPFQEFKKLFQKVELKYTKKAEKKILATTSANNAQEAGKGVIHNLNRNSKQNIYTWKEHLTQKQITYILNKTEKVRLLYKY